MSTARTTIIFMLLVIAGLVTYAGPRLQLPKPRLMPVKKLPRQIGDWTAVTDRKVADDVQKALPTAVIVDRDYRNSEGRTVSFLLLSASEIRDIHSPSVCLPGSGWRTDTDNLVERAGFRITARVMSIRDSRFHVWYWYPSVPFVEPKQPLVRMLYRWRLTAPGTYRPDTLADLSSSMMARVIAPDTPGALKDVQAFVDAIARPINEMISTASQVR